MNPIEAFQKAGYTVTDPQQQPGGGPPAPGAGAGGDAGSGGGKPATEVPGAGKEQPGAQLTQQEIEANFLKGFSGGRFASVDALNQHLAAVEADAEKAKVDPFANAYVKGLNDAIKNGIDPAVYERVANLDPAKTSDRDALILHSMWKNKLSREEAELLVDTDYKLGEGVNAEEQDVKVAHIRAKKDANEAREFLTQYKVSQLTPPAEVQAAQMKAAWAPVFPTLQQQFTHIKIQGNSGTYEFPISETAKQNAFKLLEETVHSGMIDVLPDADGLKFAQTLLQKEIQVQMMSEMLDTLMDEAKRKEAIQRHNPRAGAAPTGAQSEKAKADAETYQFLASQRGVKLKTYS